MKVYANNTEIVPVDGVYTIKKVKVEQYIRAENILSNYVTVTFVQTSLFKFNGDLTCRKNSTYTFTLTKLDDLIKDEGIEVSVNSNVVTPVNGVYSVEVTKEDLYIEVTKFSYDDPTEDDDENKGDNPVEDLD